MDIESKINLRFWHWRACSFGSTYVYVVTKDKQIDFSSETTGSRRYDTGITTLRSSVRLLIHIIWIKNQSRPFRLRYTTYLYQLKLSMAVLNCLKHWEPLGRELYFLYCWVSADLFLFFFCFYFFLFSCIKFVIFCLPVRLSISLYLSISFSFFFILLSFL